MNDETKNNYLEMVKENGFALKFAKVQTPEICALAVLQNNEAAQYIK